MLADLEFWYAKASYCYRQYGVQISVAGLSFYLLDESHLSLANMPA